MGRSSLRRTELDQLMLEYAMDPLVVLRIHEVRWLSRGQVMQRIFDCMLMFLQAFHEDVPTWYHKLTSFQSQFLIRLLEEEEKLRSLGETDVH